MANRSNEPTGYAKQKLFFLREMFAEHTDADHGITMKEGSSRVSQFHQFGNWLDDASLVVCELNRNKSSSRFDCLACSGKVHHTVLRDRQKTHIEGFLQRF